MNESFQAKGELPLFVRLIRSTLETKGSDHRFNCAKFIICTDLARVLMEIQNDQLFSGSLKF